MASITRLLSCILILLSSGILGCEMEGLKRPFGYMRLGPIKGYLGAETYLPDKRLILRRDTGGLSAMSTQCTHDLSPLKRVQENGVSLWVSEITDSKYQDDGTVLHGPAKLPLPYFTLEFASGVYGGPIDTLYVKVGEEEKKEWRLAVPTPAPTVTSTPAG